MRVIVSSRCARDCRWLIALSLAAAFVLQGGLSFGPMPVNASALENAGQCVNASAGRAVGIGLCTLHGDLGIGVKFWTTNAMAVGAYLLASSGGGAARAAGKAEEKVLDTCYLDGYLAVGAESPVSKDPSWQRYDVSVGVELTLPGLSNLALSVETGVSLKHYYSWWAWHWSSESFVAVELDLYF